jgi:hypothetical protein
MKTIREIRHDNWVRLFEMYKDSVWKQFPDQPDRGMLRHFAKAIDKSERFLSHMNCDAKPMGSNVARELETFMGLPEGWMDTEHGNKVDTSEQQFLAVMSMLYKQAPADAMRLMTEQLAKRLDIGTVVALNLREEPDASIARTSAPSARGPKK